MRFRSDIEISSNGSFDAYVILAGDVTVRLIPTSELGCAYRVIPSLTFDPKSPLRPPVEIFVVSIEDNTSVAMETDNETTPTTINSFETFAAKTRMASEELQIFSTKPVAVFTMEYGLENGNVDGNTTTRSSRILTVMQAVPVIRWPTGYRLSCLDCDNLSIDAAIFGK